jgi:hypothetical protein
MTLSVRPIDPNLDTRPAWLCQAGVGARERVRRMTNERLRSSASASHVPCAGTGAKGVAPPVRAFTTKRANQPPSDPGRFSTAVTRRRRPAGELSPLGGSCPSGVPLK